MKKILLTAILILALVQVDAQPIRIGLFQDEVVESLVIYFTQGEYILRENDRRIAELEKGDILFAVLEDGSVRLHDAKRVYGTYSSVALESTSLDGTFRIRPVIPALASRSYDDDLLLQGHDRFITIINRVDTDKYIAGVLESETGPNNTREFYKAHSLLIRTYALKHYERHREEGFSLCDGVHCQAYKGRSVYNPEIQEAVFETSGEVITDYHYKLITAAYHANSGGETQRASDVWTNGEEYLQAVIDPHSLHQPQAKWRDTIRYADWKNYLLEKGMESVKKIPEELLYVQQRHRKKYLVLDSDSLRMTTIRSDWNWKSTFFNMFPEEDDQIAVWGKGYGHGVGLSQEGAMKMARDGYNYRDIIQFYYYNVRLMHYEDLPRSSLPDMNF